MDKIMKDIEKEAFEMFKIGDITSCNCLVWAYNMIAIELGRPEMLDLNYSHSNREWQLYKENKGRQSNV